MDPPTERLKMGQWTGALLKIVAILLFGGAFLSMKFNGNWIN
jgi:hypothetical protein